MLLHSDILYNVGFIAVSLHNQFHLISLETKVRDGSKDSPVRDCRELFTENPEFKITTYWVREVADMFLFSLFRGNLHPSLMAEIL